MKEHREYFHTEDEAYAFLRGVEYVNDSALKPLGVEQHGEDGAENSWVAIVADDDEPDVSPEPLSSCGVG